MTHNNNPCDWVPVVTSDEASLILERAQWQLVQLSGDGKTLALADGTTEDRFVRFEVYYHSTGASELDFDNELIRYEISNSDTIDGFISALALSSDGATVAVQWTTTTGPDRVRTYRLVPGNPDAFGGSDELYLLIDDDILADDDFDSFHGLELSDDGNALALQGTNHVRLHVFISDGRGWTRVGNELPLFLDLGATREIALSSTGQVVAFRNLVEGENGIQVFQLRSDLSFWDQLGSDIVIAAPPQYDLLGSRSLALSSDGKTVAAVRGGIRDSDPPVESRVLVFGLNEDDQWVRLGNEIDTGLSQIEGFVSLALSADGRKLSVGVSSQVLLYTFHSAIEEWLPISNSITGSTDDDQFGRTVSLSDDGTVVLIGAGSGSAGYLAIEDDTCISAVLDRTASPTTSSAPTSLPSSPPSGAPVTENPSPAPVVVTSQPSAMPSRGGSFEQAQLDQISINLLGAKELSLGEIDNFEDITEDWYEDFFAANSESSGARSMTTRISVRSQNASMTDDGSPFNTIYYDQSASYFLLDSTLTIEDLIVRPFLNSVDKLKYGELLAANIEAFENLDQNSISRPMLPASLTDRVPEETSTASGTSGSVSDKQTPSTTLIIVIAVGAAAGIVLLAVAILMVRRKRGIFQGSNDNRSASDESQGPEGSLLPHTAQPMLVVDPRPDMYATATQLPNGDETEVAALPLVPAILENSSPDEGLKLSATDSFQGPQFKDQARPAASERQNDEDVHVSSIAKVANGPVYKDQVRNAVPSRAARDGLMTPVHAVTETGGKGPESGSAAAASVRAVTDRGPAFKDRAQSAAPAHCTTEAEVPLVSAILDTSSPDEEPKIPATDSL